MIDRISETDSHPSGQAGMSAPSAAFCARLLIVGAAVYVLSRMAVRMQAVVIPVVVAVLLAAALAPLVGWLHRRG